jgi:hypothetical protein
LEEGGLGGRVELGVFGEAGQQVELQVVGWLRVAVPVEESHHQELGQAEPESLNAKFNTRSRLSFLRPMVEKEERFYSYVMRVWVLGLDLGVCLSAEYWG